MLAFMLIGCLETNTTDVSDDKAYYTQNSEISTDQTLGHGGKYWYQISETDEYLAQHENISDVILTGGEPLLTSDERLDYLLSNLRMIEHIDIIRFHTRAPVVLPSRIDEGLLKIMRKHKRKGKPIYVY